MAPKRRATRAAQLASPPLPTLPNETLLHIIRLSIPSPSFDDFTERSASLRSYALVNRNWRSLAQAELFSHPVVRCWDQGRQLEHVLLSRRGKGLASFARTLRVDTSQEQRPFTFDKDVRLSELVDVMKSLRAISLDGIRGVIMEQLAAGSSLEAVSFTNCGFTSKLGGRPRKRPFQLRRLFLAHCHFHSSTFPSHLLPHLRALSVTGLTIEEGSYDVFAQGALNDSTQAINTLTTGLASQLVALQLDTTTAPIFEPHLASFSSLRALDIDTFDARELILQLYLIPHPLTTLRISSLSFVGSYAGASDFKTQHLKAILDLFETTPLPVALSQLRSLHLAPGATVPDTPYQPDAGVPSNVLRFFVTARDNAIKAYMAKLSDVRVALERRGIRLADDGPEGEGNAMTFSRVVKEALIGLTEVEARA